MQIFSLNQKITISEYNAVSQYKTDSFFLLIIKTISICHVLANHGHAYITCSKSQILQTAVLDYFLTSTFTNTTFQFSKH